MIYASVVPREILLLSCFDCKWQGAIRKILDGDMLSQFLDLTSMQQEAVLALPLSSTNKIMLSSKQIPTPITVNEVVRLLERVHYALNWSSRILRWKWPYKNAVPSRGKVLLLNHELFGNSGDVYDVLSSFAISCPTSIFSPSCRLITRVSGRKSFTFSPLSKGSCTFCHIAVIDPAGWCFWAELPVPYGLPFFFMRWLYPMLLVKYMFCVALYCFAWL